ncbi:MAG: hypothetical protein U1E47_06555 [Rivihabitans pingtungensis]
MPWCTAKAAEVDAAIDRLIAQHALAAWPHARGCTPCTATPSEARTMLEPHAQTLNPLDQAIIDRLQGDFPLCAYPYDEAAAPLGIDADTLMARLDTLLARRVLTRFGPMFQVERMGGAFVLAALAAPEARFAEVAEQVNALPEVAHNYRREHTLNMWFVLATAHPDGIDAARQRIEAATGLTVRLFPKLREYYVGMRFTVGGRARGRRSDPPPQPRPATPLSAAYHRAGARLARPACRAAAAPIRRWPTAWAGKKRR